MKAIIVDRVKLVITAFALLTVIALVYSDLVNKQGYISTYQTIIAALVALLAAILTYRHAIHEKRQRSMIIANFVWSSLSVVFSSLTAVKRCMNEQRNYYSIIDILESDLSLTYDHLKSIDIQQINSDIGFHVGIVLSSLFSIKETALALKRYKNDEKPKKEFEQIFLARVNIFEKAFKRIESYGRENAALYGPYIPKNNC